MRQRFIAALIAISVLIIGYSIAAQETNTRTLTYGQPRSDTFPIAPADPVSHEWTLDASDHDIVRLKVWRTGGQFTPRVALRDAEGARLTPTERTSNNHTDELIFQQGIPSADAYTVVVTAFNATTDTAIPAGAYTLQAEYLGTQRSPRGDNDASLLPTPDTSSDFFSTDARQNSQLNLLLYGDATVSRPEETTGIYRVTGENVQLTVDNTNPIARSIGAIALRDDIVALRTANEETIVVVDRSIRNLVYDPSSMVTTITLANGVQIASDFYRIQRLQVHENRVSILTTEGQRLVFDGRNYELRRRGGLAGEGPNAEPVNRFVVDGVEWQSDLSAWETLTYISDELHVNYPDGLRVVSDVPQLDLFQRGNSTNPALDADDLQTRIIELTLIRQDEARLPITIDPTGMGDLMIHDGELRIAPLDGRQMTEPLDALSAMTIDQRLVTIQRQNDSWLRVLPDDTRISTPATIPDDTTLSPTDDDFRPAYYNNLGTTIFDYHPQVAPAEAVEPFNRINGNFHYQVGDYTLPSHTVTPEWTRYYNSRSDGSTTPDYMLNAPQSYLFGQMGTRWRHSYQYELDVTFAPKGEIRLILPDGSQHLFTEVTNSTPRYRSNSLLSWTITERSDHTWQAATADGHRYHFDAAGRLQRIADVQEDTLLLSPMPIDRLDAAETGGFIITEPYGRHIELYTDDTGLITRLVTTSGETIHYTYNDAGHLTHVQRLADDDRTTYEYTDTLLTRIHDPQRKHPPLALQYDDAQRLIAYTQNPSAAGNAPAVTMTVRYLTDGSTETTQVVNGVERVHRWEYDDDWRLTRHQLPRDNWFIRYNYDAISGQLSEIAGVTRAVMRFRFDEFGYLQTLRDPIYATTPYQLTYETTDNGVQLLTRIDSPSSGDAIYQTFRYDDQQRLIRSTRLLQHTPTRDEHITEYVYDEHNRLTRITAPAADGQPRSTTYTYDSFGYPSQMTYLDRTTDFTFDASGRLLQTTDASGTTTLHWDTAHNRLNAIETPHRRTDYGYDAAGRLAVELTNGAGETYSYNGLNQLTSVTDELGRIRRYRYDEVGNLLSITLPDDANSMRQFTYDKLDHLRSETSPEGFITRYETTLNIDSNQLIHAVTTPDGETRRDIYDANQRIRRVTYTDASGVDTFNYNLNYNARGNLTTISETHVPAGRTLTLIHDAGGRVQQSTVASATTTYDHNAAGYLTAITDPDGRTLSYDYDAYGNVIRATQPDGSDTRYAYDAQDNLTQFTDANGNTTQYIYDDRHRLIEQVNPLGEVTRYEYDDQSRLTAYIDPRGGRTQLTYDAGNRITAIESADGERTLYAYDNRDQLQTITRPLGLEIDLTYDREGNVVAEGYPRERDILYGRDSLGRIINRINALGHTTIFTYNNIGELARRIDPLGNDNRYQWSASGRPVVYTSAADQVFTYGYNPLGQLTSINTRFADNTPAVNARFSYTDAGYLTRVLQGTARTIDTPEGINQRYTYDANGNVASYRGAEMQSAWEFTYNSNQQVIRSTDPLGAIAEYEYDAAGRLIRKTTAATTDAARTTRYDYDANGNLITHTLPDGTQHRYVYDAMNRVVQHTQHTANPDADTPPRTTRYTYNALGYLEQMTDPNGHITRFSYDEFGNLIQLERPIDDPETEPVHYQFQYDRVNNRTRITSPGDSDINLTYNVLNQRVRYVDAEDSVYSYSYNALGNLTQITDPQGNALNYVYNDANQISQIQYATGATVDVSYDNNGNLNSLTLPETAAGRERIEYAHDAAGNLVRIGHGAASETTFERDDLGRITAITDALDQTTRYTYDAHGQLIRITTPDDTQTRDYDAAGRLIRISGDSGTTRYEYNAAGNLTRVVAPDVTIDYTYDAAGNVISRDAGAFGRIRYRYDALYRPVEIQIDDTTLSVEYNADGRPTLLTADNGLRTRYTYDDAGRITALFHLNANNERLDGFTYQYDAVGNITRITRADGWSVLYSYDALNQLISERWFNPDNQTAYSVTYSYDDAGNRIEAVTRRNQDNPERTLYRYNDQNQLISEVQNANFSIEDRLSPATGNAASGTANAQTPATQSDPSVTYAYNANGSLQRATYANGNQLAYQYDAQNRLTGIAGTQGDGTPVDTRITYDEQGRIYDVTLAADDPAITYRYLYDQNGLIGIIDTSSDERTVYYRPQGHPYLRVDTPTGTQWRLSDASGAVRKLADDAGNLRMPERSGYNLNSFGERITPYGNEAAYPDYPQPLFVGQLFDPTSELYLMGVRAYTPAAGRFIQRDPVRHDPRGSLYTYAHNRPGVLTDPSGMTPEKGYDGLSPNIPVVDYNVRPAAVTSPADSHMPSIPRLQAAENHRLLTVAATAETTLNYQIGAFDGCTFHIMQAPNQHQSQSITPDDFGMASGWMPADRAVPTNAIPDAAALLAPTNHTLEALNIPQRPMTSCASRTIIPPAPPAPQHGLLPQRQRHQFASLLDEIPLYTGIEQQIRTLQPAAIVPTVPSPMIETPIIDVNNQPDLPVTLRRLHNSLHTFYTQTRLPAPTASLNQSLTRRAAQPPPVQPSIQTSLRPYVDTVDMDSVDSER